MNLELNLHASIARAETRAFAAEAPPVPAVTLPDLADGQIVPTNINTLGAVYAADAMESLHFSGRDLMSLFAQNLLPIGAKPTPLTFADAVTAEVVSDKERFKID